MEKRITDSFDYDEIKMLKSGEQLMRVSFKGQTFEMVFGANSVEAMHTEDFSKRETALLLSLLPDIDTPAAFVIGKAAADDLPRDEILFAAEKNWSIVIGDAI